MFMKIFFLPVAYNVSIKIFFLVEFRNLSDEKSAVRLTSGIACSSILQYIYGTAMHT